MGTTVIFKPAAVQRKALSILKGGAKHILGEIVKAGDHYTDSMQYAVYSGARQEIVAL
jgi:hypothetical protein